MAIPEVGRLAGHVLLDAVSAWDDSAPEGTNERAINLALERLSEIGAVRATLDDESGAVELDASDLVGPAVLLLLHAIGRAALHGPSEEVILTDLRAGLDSD